MTEPREWRDRSQDKAGFAYLHQRIDAIERNILEIRGLLERLVRVEERLQASNSHLSRIEEHINAIDERLCMIENSSNKNNWLMGGIERFGWIVAAAAAAWLSTKF